MDLYTLNSAFRQVAPIEDTISKIWTERYSSAGDIQIVAPATEYNRAVLADGAMIACAGTNEIMFIETTKEEKGVLTSTGPTLVEFLDQRVFRSSNVPHNVTNYKSTLPYSPGQWMSKFVEWSVIYDPTYSDIRIDHPRSIIPNLTLGAVDTTGVTRDVDVPFGPVYSIIRQFAQTYDIGMSLYLEGVTASGYSLKFKTYTGTDLSSLVRFRTALDTLSNAKELCSRSAYKNVAFAYATNMDSTIPADSILGPPVLPSGKAWVGSAINSVTGFDRRVMSVNVSDIPQALLDAGDWPPIQTILNARAKDALLNNNYIRMIDGTIVPQPGITYGTDYKLGDIIGLESDGGTITRARVTEYIRSEDQAGERAYPTISALSS